ncbi:MAG: type II secretion system F family protein, partial [bacterium]
MPVYAFKGRDYEEGSPVVGEEYAESKHVLARSLRGRGIFPVSITEKKIVTTFPGIKPKAPGLRAMSQFARQFAVMLQAGLPLVQCLSVLVQQQENAGFRATLIEVRAEIEGGSTLSDALGKHPRVFNQFFVDMIAVGEAGGFLEVAFHRLSVYIQRAAKIKSQALSASAYPLIVMAVALVTVSLTLVWVVPVFVSLFQGLDAPLPFPTRLVIMFSDLTTRCIVP